MSAPSPRRARAAPFPPRSPRAGRQGPAGPQRGLSTVAEIALIGAGILAVLILLVIVGQVSMRARRSAPLEADPKAYVTLRAPRGEIVAPPREFAWRAVEGASSYRVKISDEDALWPLFVKTTDRSPLVLDAKEAKAITPGRIHIWEVDALDAAGNPIARGTSRFRFTPADSPPTRTN